MLVLVAKTEQAKEWIEGNLPDKTEVKLISNNASNRIKKLIRTAPVAVYVDHRYIDDITYGIRKDGLRYNNFALAEI